MSTIEQQIADLAKQFADLAAPFNDKLAELNAARDFANASGDQAIDDITLRFDPRSINIIWIDPVNGDDANSGKSGGPGNQSGNAVQSWKRAFDLMNNAGRQQLRVCNPMTVDQLVVFQSFNPLLDIVGFDTDGQTPKRQRLTFVDSVEPGQASFCGGLQTSGQLQMRLQNIDCELASSKTTSPFTASSTMMHVWWTLGQLTKTGNPPAGTGSMFEPQGFGAFRFSSVVIDASARGFVIDDVPAGGNPNDNPLIIADFTSA